MARKEKAMKSWNPQRLKALRAKYDLTQAELAEVLGVKLPTVKYWEISGLIPLAAQNHLTLVERYHLPEVHRELQPA